MCRGNSKIIFSDRQYEFFDGIMASDGSLVGMPEVKANYRFATSLKHTEFALHIQDMLGIDLKIKERWIKDGRLCNGGTKSVYINSGNDSIFTRERARWYPNGKKIIPNDFRFSPVSMNAWYLGDGTRTSGGGRRAIELCTQSFDCDNLGSTIIPRLHSVGINCWINNAGKVYIPNDEAPKYLEYIGVCPVHCYEHKWDLGCFTRKNKVIFKKEYLYKMYVLEGLSSVQIARLFGVSKRMVLHYLHKFDIIIKGRQWQKY